MLLRIEGTDLPGLSCPQAPGFPGYANIHVGVQRKDRPAELLDLQPGDAAAVSWDLECEAKQGPDGVELHGRHIQNRLGGRFVYLSWGEVDAEGGFHMFRRAKLMLRDVPPEVLAAAVESGTLVGRLGLTDPKGNPTCATTQVVWAAG
jgi:hypothetical protein